MATENADASARADLCGVMVVTAVTAATGKLKTLYVIGEFYSGGKECTSRPPERHCSYLPHMTRLQDTFPR